MSIFAEIENLVNYAVNCGLIDEIDRVYAENKLSDILGLSEFLREEASEKSLEETLISMCEYAADKGIIENTQTDFDLFDTRIMGALAPYPREVAKRFSDEYKKSPRVATDWYYKFSQDTDYIRRYRIARDVKWEAETGYGTLDITINLAKPEKDPREIARARTAPKSGYPACPLCRESEGYAGRSNFPARQNHRVIPIEICGKQWYFQYSPYVYYNEHCIALSGIHEPMRIDHDIFPKLFGFLDVFPHYFIGSNADLPIVGGSILSHEHFQGGNYTFAMERAPIEKEYVFEGYEDVTAGRVKWPMSVIRLCCTSKERISELACKILDAWRVYTDEGAFIFSETDNVPHNTITPIARMRDGKYELDLVLRNNITTEEHPLGVFHPHEHLHHIKRENIGLIEVMGLAVLPARIKKELSLLVKYIDEGLDIASCEDIEKHSAWIRDIMGNRRAGEDTEAFLKREIGKVFSEVLECAGVFKRNEAGMCAFDRFIDTI